MIKLIRMEQRVHGGDQNGSSRFVTRLALFVLVGFALWFFFYREPEYPDSYSDDEYVNSQYDAGRSGNTSHCPHKCIFPPSFFNGLLSLVILFGNLDFTAAEVRQHAKCSNLYTSFDLWLAIDSNVYNVSAFGTFFRLLPTK
jgi:hypothetical protein